MITTTWDQIDAGTLQALCDAGAPESPTLDFKRVAPLKQGEDPRNEFAKDVCAFANANGGDLVYGIATREDCADTLAPLSGESADACKRRLSEVLANHVEPRIAGVRFKDLPIDERGFALVVRVPRSFDAPHRYKVRSHDGVHAHHRFVTRSDTGTLDMDYAQLRDSFGRTATLVEQARAFRATRLRLMMSEGQLLHGFEQGHPKFCVHLVPLAGLIQATAINISDVYHRHDINFAKPGGFVPQKQTNLDGLLMTGSRDAITGRIGWLVRLFRSGAMEYLAQASSQVAAEDGGDAFIPAVATSREIRRVCGQLLSHARALGLEGPALLGLAGVNTARHPFRIFGNGTHYGNTLADREHLVLADHWIDELSAETDIDTAARPMLDEYWQCFGEVRCELYDEAGQWRTAT